MTPFALLSQACGLSHREAAEFLGVRLDTVKSWSSGRNRAPASVLDDLRHLWAEIDFASDRAAALIGEQAAGLPIGETIEIGYPADDHEARDLGLPCVGAWRAMCARVVARIRNPIKLLPRGSTPALAAAADAGEQGS